MNKKISVFFLSILLSIFCLGGCLPTNAAETNVATTGSLENAIAINPIEIPEPLPSWNNNDHKQAIIAFVNKITNPKYSGFVKIEDRIAVFDNDGTLWAERPNYFQEDFLKNESATTAQAKNSEGKIKSSGIKESLGDIAVFDGITTEDYISQAHDFVYETIHNDIHFEDDNTSYQRFNAPYTDLTYKPVIELVNYLKANGFKVYICSGGGVDFVRAFAEEAYGIPPEKVIGSAVSTRFVDQGESVSLIRNPMLGQYNDQQNKPVGIERHIGKRPIIAVGNSSGDLEMFLYTDNGTADDTDSLIVLINHDDCEREYQYNDTEADSDDDGIPDNESLVEANQRNNWLVVSMKDDFSDIFYSQPSRPDPSCSL